MRRTCSLASSHPRCGTPRLAREQHELLPPKCNGIRERAAGRRRLRGLHRFCRSVAGPRFTPRQGTPTLPPWPCGKAWYSLHSPHSSHRVAWRSSMGPRRLVAPARADSTASTRFQSTIGPRESHAAPIPSENARRTAIVPSPMAASGSAAAARTGQPSLVQGTFASPETVSSTLTAAAGIARLQKAATAPTATVSSATTATPRLTPASTTPTATRDSAVSARWSITGPVPSPAATGDGQPVVNRCRGRSVHR